MGRRYLVGLTIILAVGAACNSDGIPAPSIGFDHAVMTPACGPADGPAVAIYLASSPIDHVDPPTPFVRIAVWQPLDHVGGRTWRFGIGGGDSASAVLVTGPNDYNVAIGGYVTLNVIDTTSTTEGSAELEFIGVDHIAGGFHAAWSSAAAPLCG
jgi:hypothetical protein